ncbi:MAG: M23 family metallopeptidase [bacterium]|nr:M23 family metallopeptidase [bacterium]
MKEILYKVPVVVPDGGPPTIFQGWNGQYSHNGTHPSIDLTYAVDFAVVPGTPVVAARGGKITIIHQAPNEPYFGLDPAVGFRCPVTFIAIDQGDGTQAVYAHLDPESIFVTEGNIVSEGAQLARSGLSGWIGPSPHVHFHVQATEMDLSTHKRRVFTLPIQFK